jgi:hypothetical protein
MTGTVIKIEICHHNNSLHLSLFSPFSFWHSSRMKIQVPSEDKGLLHSDTSVRTLRENETFRISTGAGGCRVTCLDGMVWLTEGTGGRDHILRRNESWITKRPGRIVLWAVKAAAFAVYVSGPDNFRRFSPFDKGIGNFPAQFN